MVLHDDIERQFEVIENLLPIKAANRAPHRMAYIHNIQKVDFFAKWTRNSAAKFKSVEVFVSARVLI